MLKITANVTLSYILAAVLVNSVMGQWMRLSEEL